MALGSINHVALTVSDLGAAERAFYAPVLGFLGYEKVEDAPEVMKLWYHAGVRVAVNLWQATEPGDHARARPGLHHLAFSAANRSEVGAFHKMAVDAGIAILDAPADYPHYAPGYHAVYVADPDGMKFELAHMPALPD